MEDINLKYLKENFHSLDSLAERSGVSKEAIQKYIEKELLPKASYVLRQKSEITSPLGDSHSFEDKVLYFPKSYVSLVRKLNGKNSDENKDVFIAKMKNHLLNHPKKKFAYDNTESNSEKLDGELAKEWNHYLNGIYGICTLNATPEEIVEKEVAVKRLIHFIDSTKQNDWRPKQSELKEIVAAFDQVSSRFAPYQRESSSRGKYVDKSLQKLGLEDKIKGY